ncbi:hypothetical protein [Methylobacterium sp. E-016]|uniref:hypothetical protein n=1 Tax=Methylobacterium sp. E-016 TaxID=2836556 RepID=UPI00391DE102
MLVRNSISGPDARPTRRAFRRYAPILAITVILTGCMGRGEAPSPAAQASSKPVRERIAALALRQVAFGSVSLLPVRFESSRIAGPFEDGGRTLYCVSSHMKGRTFGKGERPKVVIREDKAANALTAIDDDEVCQGHRTEPFPELETLGNAKAGTIGG